MKKLLLILLMGAAAYAAQAQTSQAQLYDLVKKLIPDSTGYENVGDWAVGAPKTYPVRWKADRIEMSDDISINFFREGTAQILLPGKTTPATWQVFLKGARSGYSSFTLTSPAAADLTSRPTPDNLFGKKPFQSRLLKSCDHPEAGFYYYEIKIPRKDVAFIKMSWQTKDGKTTWRVDGYDNWSKDAAKTDCR